MRYVRACGLSACLLWACQRTDAPRKAPGPPPLPRAPLASEPLPALATPATVSAKTHTAESTAFERCDALSAGSDARALCDEIGPHPSWAVAAEKTQTELLADYGGVWTFPHSVTIHAEGANEASRVAIDELRVCAAGAQRTLYVLQSFADDDHSCALGGRAAENASGELLLIGDTPTDIEVQRLGRYVKGTYCYLRAVRESGQLKIVDSWPEDCDQAECGSGAAAVMMALPESRRRPAPCRARLSTYTE